MSILASSLALGAADYSWRDHALCRDTDPELFFPVGTTGTALVQIEKAKQVCGECDGAGRVPRLRAGHEPGLRHLGRPVRGGAPRHPPPARRPAGAATPRRGQRPAGHAERLFGALDEQRPGPLVERTHRPHGHVDAAVVARVGRPGRRRTPRRSAAPCRPALRSASAACARDRRRRRPGTRSRTVDGDRLLAEVAHDDELGVGDVQRAALVAQPGRDQPDVIDDGVERARRPRPRRPARHRSRSGPRTAPTSPVR